MKPSNDEHVETNERGISWFFALIIAVQLAMLAIVGSALLGYDIPVLRQIVGFIYLTFVPGLLILKILKVRNLSMVKTLLYSVGLSIAFIMFVGSLMNFVLPYVGISKPIATLPLLITLTAFTVILCGIAYIRDRHFQLSTTVHFSLKDLLSPAHLFLILIPILAVLGALLVTFYQDNRLLLILIPSIALILALAVFGKFIPDKAYPLMIIVLALSLLYSQSLISHYLTGSDIHIEYYYQNLVVVNSFWDSSYYSNVNGMLSITMLCPVYSLVLGIDSVWVFKIIYPLFYCLVPLALFEAYKQQTNAKTALMAAFFFMSFWCFFVEMGSLARQQVAELFLALLILLITEREITPFQKAFLIIVFVISLTISHYALAYIFIGLCVLSRLLLTLAKSRAASVYLRGWTKGFTNPSPNPGMITSRSGVASSPSILKWNTIALLAVFSFAWYAYLCSSAPFNAVVRAIYNLYESLSEFFIPSTRPSLVLAGVGLAVSPTVQSVVFKILQYITQFLIVIGFLRLIRRPKGVRFEPEYIAFTSLSMLILVGCILIPYLAFYVDMTRTYHITLFFLSPLCILGGETIWKGTISWLKLIFIRGKQQPSLPIPINYRANSTDTNQTPAYMKLLALAILIPYLLFTTGFVFEVTKCDLYGGIPATIALSSHRMDGSYYNLQECTGAAWISDVSDAKTPVYADQYGQLLLTGTLYGRASGLPVNIEKMPQDIICYIYLRSWNIEKGEVLMVAVSRAQVSLQYLNLEDSPELSNMISSMNLVYNNGRTQVLASGIIR